MNKESLKKEALLLLVLLAPIIFLLAVWNKLPSQLPIHWNLKGEVDGYGPKYIPAVLGIGIYLLMLALPKIDPRKKNYDIFSGTYYKLRLVMLLFFGAINSVIIADAIGFNMDIDRIILVGILLLITIMGNYMSTLRSNWFIGIRLPWTLESDTVWRKTHQLAGKLLFWLGLLAMILAIFLPKDIVHPVAFSIVAVIIIVPIVYSYLIYRKEKQAAH